MTTCPKCHARALACKTPAGDRVLLDPRPVDGAYTLHGYIPGLAISMLARVLRVVHRCEQQKE